MSRRDTLIIAVLVNAGLLMVLFATAMKSDRKKEQIAIASPAPIAHVAQEPLAQLALTPTLPLALVEEIVIPEMAPVVVHPTPAPVPVASTVSPSNQTLVAVTVKKGDFLEKIAKAHNTSVAAIMKENHLSSTQLKVGQVLQVPGKGVPPTTSATESLKELPATEYYVVKDGDNPWLIASKNHVRLEELLRINGLDDQSARRLRPGDRIKIR